MASSPGSFAGHDRRRRVPPGRRWSRYRTGGRLAATPCVRRPRAVICGGARRPADERRRDDRQIRDPRRPGRAGILARRCGAPRLPGRRRPRPAGPVPRQRDRGGADRGAGPGGAPDPRRGAGTARRHPPDPFLRAGAAGGLSGRRRGDGGPVGAGARPPRCGAWRLGVVGEAGRVRRRRDEAGLWACLRAAGGGDGARSPGRGRGARCWTRRRR